MRLELHDAALVPAHLRYTTPPGNEESQKAQLGDVLRKALTSLSSSSGVDCRPLWAHALENPSSDLSTGFDWQTSTVLKPWILALTEFLTFADLRRHHT